MSELYQLLQTYFADYPLLMLFVSGFLGATLLPGSSEISLYAALNLDNQSIVMIVIVATIGNTLGGMTNYYIGLFLPNRSLKKKKGLQLEAWINKYGYGALLMSWAPVIGDPLCVAAGWLRMNSWLCLLTIAIGKGARYVFLAMIFKGLM